MGDFFIEKDLYSNTNDPWINFSKEKIKVFNSARFESSATYLFKGPTGYSLENLFPVEKFSTNYLLSRSMFQVESQRVKNLPKYFNNNQFIKIQEDPNTSPIFVQPDLCVTLNDSGDIGFITGPSGIHVLNKINENWSTVTCFGYPGFIPPYGIRDLKCNSSGNILFVSTYTGVSIYTGYSSDWKHSIKLTGDCQPYEIDCNKYGNILAFGAVVDTTNPQSFPAFTQINSGSVYIWKEENSNWTLKDIITGTGFDFGRSISMDALGNTIITSCTRAATVSGLYKSGELMITTGNGEEWKISQIFSSNQSHDNFGYVSKINRKGDRIFCSAYGGAVSSVSEFTHRRSKINIYTGDKIFYKTSEVSGSVVEAIDDTLLYENRPGFGYHINTNEDGNVLFVGSFGDVLPTRTTSPLFVYEKHLGLEAWSTGVMSVGQRIGLDKYAKNFIISNTIFPTNFNSGYYYSSIFGPEIEVYDNILNNKVSFYKEYNYWTDYNKYKTGGFILPKDYKIKFLNFNNSGVHINELNPDLELYKDGAHLSFGEIT